jgi:uncharacterized membrane protein (DUF485 family)
MAVFIKGVIKNKNKINYKKIKKKNNSKNFLPIFHFFFLYLIIIFFIYFFNDFLKEWKNGLPDGFG